TTFLPANDQMLVDAFYFDPQASSETYPTPATYTLARLTFLNGALGTLQVRFQDTQSPSDPVRFTFIIPEPSGTMLATLFGIYTVARSRFRSFPPKLYP